MWRHAHVRTGNVDFSCKRLTSIEIRKSKYRIIRRVRFRWDPPEKDIWIRAWVRGENTPERKVASTGDQTRNHQVSSPTRSPLSHPSVALSWPRLISESIGQISFELLR